jgi:hypothetical protein
MNHSLRVALCHSATARAHLAGAEAAELEARFQSATDLAFECGRWPDGTPDHGLLLSGMRAARRRYWREVSAVQLLMGRRWPEAEALGAEP